MSVSLLAALALTGCGTPPAKDFGGSWKPVNRFQEETTAIPLNQSYQYFAAPMDGTLKNMLTRWAKDTGMKLSYQLSTDFTLYTPVAQIHTVNAREATEQLSSIYATEGVSVTVSGSEIIVGQASAVTPATTSGSTTPNDSKASPSSSSKS